MKSKLIKDLHSVNIWRHPQTRKKLESLKTSEIINIWAEFYDVENKEVNEGEVATQEA